jgi:3-methyladenine DNA glycosylase AlkD
MTVDEVMARLASVSSPDLLARNAKNGAGSVPMGDIRTIAKAIKTDHPLGQNLWATGNVDARLVALLILKPKAVSPDELEEMIRSNDRLWVSDWLNSYVLKQHPAKETLRQKWEREPQPFLARAYWSLTAERVQKLPEGLDLPALLDRLEAEMPTAPEPVQWTMNNTLAGIGIHHPAHRARAIALGETLGIYRDYPTPKGCTSPFAPLWIAEMVRRAG